MRVIVDVDAKDTSPCRLGGGIECCNCLYYRDTKAKQARAESLWQEDQAKPVEARGRKRRNKPRALVPKPININWHNFRMFEADGATEGQNTSDGRFSFWVVCVNVLSIEDYTTLLPQTYWDKPDLVAALPRITNSIRIKCGEQERIHWHKRRTRRQSLTVNEDGTAGNPWALDAACGPMSEVEWHEHKQSRNARRGKSEVALMPQLKKRRQILAEAHVTVKAGSINTCLEVPYIPTMVLDGKSSESSSTHDSGIAQANDQGNEPRPNDRLVMQTSVIPIDTTLNEFTTGWALDELSTLPASPGRQWVSDYFFDFVSDEHWYGQEAAVVPQDIRLYARKHTGPSYTSDVLAATGPASTLAFSSESWPALFTQQDVRSATDVPPNPQPVISSELVTCVSSRPGMPDMDLYNQLLQILGPSDT